MNFNELFSFKGRMRRKHFVLVWLATLALVVAIIALWQAAHVDAIVYSRYLVIAAFVPSCARRLHDMGYSGWLTIGVLVMPLALILLLILPGMPGANAYGASPKDQPA